LLHFKYQIQDVIFTL